MIYNVKVHQNEQYLHYYKRHIKKEL